ncbi:uncharacterized protein BX663DRAFT_494248 [Cokeromyces recurvatus]|uniref:uncharacterized protein n=1 Tax=Cokeromyces recurvatus TaxID=90255 RepID=UPI00221F2870|nr:uncharacterized protein BX663DRAFT_494248 [Cokeromyces recurvatus]KAI7906932.1 hypothetical protein BX663DRAFT_494248 [Cokeromyces recurvatus]
MSQPIPSAQPPAAKWIQNDNDDSDVDQVDLVPHNRGYKLKRWAASDSQFGGNKLRAPKTIAEETEFTKGDKKHTIVKRKRRRMEDGVSDDDEDPYTLINIEDILSPIEVPTDIVRRPALRRILLSNQIDALAKTSMEFIENEKNFNKILCRLSAIMHQDDPRYLDLTFERTAEQRRKYKEDMEAAKAAATTLSSAAGSTTNVNKVKQESGQKCQSSTVEPLDPKELDSEVETKIKEQHDHEEDDENNKNIDIDADVEAREVVKRVKELLLENINHSNEYIARLQGARNKLCKASMQKETLWKELKASAREEDNRNKISMNSNNSPNSMNANSNIVNSTSSNNNSTVY